MLHTNTDVHTRVWPSLSVDGHTLSLGAGESADIDVPDGFDDPYLKPVDTKPRSQKAKASDPAVPGEPDAAPAADHKE